MTDRIDPQTPSGFRDVLPAEAAARQAVLARVTQVFRRFGYVDIDTPALEREEVLTGGDPEFSKQLYRARLTEDDAPLALRFDLTVPLARFVAAHASALSFPFRRFHIGPVWRGEHAQAGRYRQFIQCDADILGANSSVADAEIIALVYALFSELGLSERLQLRVSDRRILNGLADFFQYDPEKTPAVLRAIDKLDKLGWDVVTADLKEKAGLDEQQIKGIRELLSLKEKSPEALLERAHAFLEYSPTVHEGVDALKELIAALNAFDVPPKSWSLDLSIARGLGYYTGMVFEASLAGIEQLGSVCSGGRYDNLVSRFSPLDVSGVGLSIGIDRLFAGLEELGISRPTTSGTRVAVLDFDADSRPAVLSLVADLRRSDIPVTLYVGKDESLKGQLSWAVKSGFSKAVFMGSTERTAGTVQVKDLTARTQQEVSLNALASNLRS